MDPDIVILYGSQTGNAEDMAKRIGLKAKQAGYKVLVETMDDYPLKNLPRQKMVIFVCSTTGHGQEPENMKNFYNFIRRRDLPKDCLNGLNFVVYGLGNSSYSKFNYVSKILFKRLRECGARPIQELVASDEQHPCGCDGLIYPKLSDLWNKLHQNSISPSDICDMEETNTYSLKLHSPSEGPKPEDKFSPEFRKKFNLKSAICIGNERLTDPSHFQDTRLLRFQATEDIDYEPGDVCTIYPENTTESVESFIRLLNLDPKQKIELTKRDSSYMVNYLYDFVPDGLLLEDLVRYYFDIQSIPKRSFFEYLWPFSDSQLEKEKLREFASTEGQGELYDYCVRPKRSILETMVDFPNTVKNIKPEYLFDIIPPIKPRSFSIASSANAHRNEIHLIVGIVTYKTMMRELRKGLCSHFLSSFQPVTEPSLSDYNGNVLRFFIRNSAFKLPLNHQLPIIMVGPGLGIAPFRGFIEERAKSGSTRKCANSLYFGCRYLDKDFYFKNELVAYSESGLLRLRVAFSRLEPKRYVQDVLMEDSVLISRLIRDEKAIVYVAGNSKLPEELRTLIGKLITYHTGDTVEEQAADIERVVNELEAQNRIQYDCW